MSQKGIQSETGGDRHDQLVSTLSRLWEDPVDRQWMANLVAALDAKYGLGAKLEREDGVQDILAQMVGRIARAFPRMADLRGKRILDIASGSNTSMAPSSLQINTPFGKRGLNPATSGYTALFEPWFCRILLELDANPVGVDFGDLDGEAFEHYRVDLGQIGALDFLPGASFDAVQDSRLFGSPEFTAQFPDPVDRRKVAAEIRQQELRVLKPGGIFIHSDARDLLEKSPK